MMKIRVLLPLLMLVLGLRVYAQTGPNCASDLASTPAPLTLVEAEKIIGDSTAAPQVRAALGYILDHPELSYGQKVQDLDQLFLAISQFHYFTWKSNRFTAPDGSIGFAGELGFFVWLKHDGKIFKGKLTSEHDIDSNKRWNGRFDTMSEVVKLAPLPVGRGQ